ncbi:MAG: hypothetical protein IJC54_03935 [Clostridia bacterium]|nr:hypothetical protein [Clostridia bacterium]
MKKIGLLLAMMILVSTIAFTAPMEDDANDLIEYLDLMSVQRYRHSYGFELGQTGIGIGDGGSSEFKFLSYGSDYVNASVCGHDRKIEWITFSTPDKSEYERTVFALHAVQWRLGECDTVLVEWAVSRIDTVTSEYKYENNAQIYPIFDENEGDAFFFMFENTEGYQRYEEDGWTERDLREQRLSGLLRHRQRAAANEVSQLR